MCHIKVNANYKQLLYIIYWQLDKKKFCYIVASDKRLIMTCFCIETKPSLLAAQNNEPTTQQADTNQNGAGLVLQLGHERKKILKI